MGPESLGLSSSNLQYGQTNPIYAPIIDKNKKTLRNEWCFKNSSGEPTSHSRKPTSIQWRKPKMQKFKELAGLSDPTTVADDEAGPSSRTPQFNDVGLQYIPTSVFYHKNVHNGELPQSTFPIYRPSDYADYVSSSSGPSSRCNSTSEPGSRPNSTELSRRSANAKVETSFSVGLSTRPSTPSERSLRVPTPMSSAGSEMSEKLKSEPPPPETIKPQPPTHTQKLLFSGENWALVDVGGGAAPRTAPLQPLTAASKDNNDDVGRFTGVGVRIRRPKTTPTQMVMFKSGLNVRVYAGSTEHEYFKDLSQQPTSGYSEENSCQALKKFAKRGVVDILQSNVINDTGAECSAEMMLNVPSLNVAKARFSASASKRQMAEKKCALRVLNSLYSNSVIKEANIEFHKRRKAFMDSSKDLDVKLQGYLGSDPMTFSKLLDDIASHDEYFY